MFIIRLVTIVLLFFLPSVSVPKLLLVSVGLLLVVGFDVVVNFVHRVERVLVKFVVCSLD